MLAILPLYRSTFSSAAKDTYSFHGDVMLTSVTPWLFVFDQKKKELVFPVDIFEFQMCVYFKQCLHFFFSIFPYLSSSSR